ncbi:hypothetical protein ACPV4B_08120 [Vibrio parahaemolyticus]|uniref:hypothetical protein n=1 Tax=Vibrio mediterranei TaxID=689 RepID=UPI0040693888
MNILFLSHTYIGCRYVVGSHHLSKALSDLGHCVVHIPHPWSSIHKMVKGERSNFLEGQVSPNRWQFLIGELLPSKWNMVALDFDGHSKRLAKKIIKHCSAIGIDHFDFCFVDDPIFQKTCRYLPIDKLIYRPTDIYPEMPNGRAYKNTDKQLIEKSDIVIATNKQILKYHDVEGRHNTFVLNNGFDMEHFCHTQRRNHGKQKLKSRLSACYVGALDHRFDFNLINSAAKICKEVDFDIYSPGEPSRLDLSLSNIHYLGPLDYQQLPSTLAKYGLLIMPFTFDLSNRGRSPMKLFEYAASNVPILVPDYMDTFGIESVSKYSNLDSFIDAIKRTPTSSNLTRNFETLKPHSWPVKAKKLLDIAQGKTP